jgi:hypothetical protein
MIFTVKTVANLTQADTQEARNVLDMSERASLIVTTCSRTALAPGVRS